MMEGFLLGLSNGTTCIAHCAPVIVPYFLGEGNETKRNIVSLSGFLSGRMIGYLSFAFVAWIFGNAISEFPIYRNLLFGIIFLLLSIFMAYSGLFASKDRCAFKSMHGIVNRLFLKNKWMMTVLLGILTGINFCPPFLLAFSSTAYDGSLANSLYFFFTFYLGTVLYFIPIIFLGVLSRESNFQTIGKMMSVIMAAYFFYKAFFMIAGCLT
jgi:sulfite exporter TauE/SafE